MAKSLKTRVNEQWARVEPGIERVLRKAFGGMRDRDQADELTQAARCLAFGMVRRLVVRDRIDRLFPGAIAWYAVRQARCGRDLTGIKRHARLAITSPSLNQVAREDEGLGCRRPGDHLDPMTLIIDTQGREPCEEVAFREAWNRWMNGMSRGKAKIYRMLAIGERTQDVAATTGMTPGRISQLRREAWCEWRTWYV